MAEPQQSEHAAPGRRRAGAQTKTLGVLVAVMVVAGVVALIMTVFGSSSSGSQAGSQPADSQVGQQSTTTSSAAATPTSAAAAATPTSAAAAATPTSAAPSATPASAASAATKRTSASAGAATKIVKYRVRKGDNLTLIAGWFNQRGYGLVYDWNKSVIGRNPNLIYPGQTIIVSLNGDTMHVSTSTK